MTIQHKGGLRKNKKNKKGSVCLDQKLLHDLMQSKLLFRQWEKDSIRGRLQQIGFCQKK